MSVTTLLLQLYRHCYTGIVLYLYISNTFFSSNRHTFNVRVYSTIMLKKRQRTDDTVVECPVKTIIKCRKSAITDEFPIGCGKFLLAANHVEALRTLSQMIVDKIGVKQMISWGEGIHDKKVRGYGMLEDSQKWFNANQLEQAGILMHHEGGENDPDPVKRQEAQQKHEDTLKQAFPPIHLSPAQLSAINAVIDSAQDIVRGWPSDEIKTYERDCISLSELVAIQPNVHNNDMLLPLHLDQPRHDGFGIVIVTVGIQGSGDIVINDPGPDVDSIHRNWSFPLQPGEMYVLCGPSRNLCR